MNPVAWGWPPLLRKRPSGFATLSESILTDGRAAALQPKRWMITWKYLRINSYCIFSKINSWSYLSISFQITGTILDKNTHFRMEKIFTAGVRRICEGTSTLQSHCLSHWSCHDVLHGQYRTVNQTKSWPELRTELTELNWSVFICFHLSSAIGNLN